MIRFSYVSVVALIVTIAISSYGFYDLNKSKSVILDLYHLKSDILIANISLRNAIITTSEIEKVNELNKMLVTRNSANQIYDRLVVYGLSDLEEAIIKNMIEERKEYRKYQLEIIDNIKTKNTLSAWHNMSYYSTLMERYIQRVDTIISIRKEESENVYICVKYSILAILMGICISFIVLVSKERF